MPRLVALLVVCAAAVGRAEPFTVGPDWIANDVAKVQVTRGRLRYFRRAGDEWTAVADGSTGAVGMGYALLLGATPTDIAIRRTDDRAELTYRLAGEAAEPRVPIWIEYRLSLQPGNPCVEMTMTAASDDRLKLFVFIGPSPGNSSGVAPASRYIVFDRDLGEGRYAVDLRDAAGVVAAATPACTYTRFVATWSHLNGTVVAVYGVPAAPGPKPCRATAGWGGGTGFGRLELRASCAIMAAVVDLADLDDVAHYVERGYWQYVSTR